MSFITKIQGYIFLAIFGIAMILITYFFARWKKYKTKEGFLVANRQLSWLLGGPSIAASWIWAGALFVSVQLAYEKGIAGLFWFTFPNVIALILFAFWAPKIRHNFPKGFTLPQFIKKKYKSNKLHKLYLIPFVFEQIIAITFNLFAGGTLFSLLTGISFIKILPILALIALAYTLMSGIEASIVTDLIQIGLILVGIFIIVPWTLIKAGGLPILYSGLGGLNGKFTNIFNPSIAFSLGIVSSIGLISNTIADQQYWQRTFSLKDRDISKAFILGGILFAVVPIMLGLLGFLGRATNIVIPAKLDTSMVGVLMVSNLLPHFVLIIFIIVLLGGLSSTIDSAISAMSSLWITDIVKTNNPIKQARYSMIGITVLGLIFAYAAHFIKIIEIKHLWFLSISIVASISVPTILSIYKNNINPDYMFIGILLALIIGIPTFFYSSIINNSLIQVSSSIYMISISTIFTLTKKKYKIIK